jgi:hypothetical protein
MEESTVKKVRSKIDNQLIGTRVYAKGEVGECDDDRAKVLVARGLVEYIDGDDGRTVVTQYPGREGAAETAVRKAPAPVENAVQKGK